jgi:hypothetical protein
MLFAWFLAGGESPSVMYIQSEEYLLCGLLISSASAGSLAFREQSQPTIQAYCNQCAWRGTCDGGWCSRWPRLHRAGRRDYGGKRWMVAVVFMPRPPWFRRVWCLIVSMELRVDFGASRPKMTALPKLFSQCAFGGWSAGRMCAWSAKNPQKRERETKNSG